MKAMVRAAASLRAGSRLAAGGQPDVLDALAFVRQLSADMVTRMVDLLGGSGR
jgi:hypothetical protein